MKLKFGGAGLTGYMKTRSFLILAALALIGSFVPAQAQNNKALAAFKADYKAANDAAGKAKKQSSSGDDPTEDIRAGRLLLGRLRKVRTDGIPGDLKSAFTEFVAAFAKTQEVYDGMPDTKEAFVAYVTKKLQQDPQFAKKLTDASDAADKKLKFAAARFWVVRGDYGID